MELDEAADALRRKGSTVVALPTDVSDPAQVERFVGEALKTLGRVDILVNNAGVAGRRGPLAEVTPADWAAVLAINLTGPFLCARAVIPAMRRQGGGSIINVSSWLGRNAMEHWGAYGAAKWGLEGLTQYLALELKRDRIRVNSVSPGMVATRMTDFAGDPPERVTPLFLYLASDASRRVTGRALDVATWRPALRL
jgi:NAD(P)-dependent dehydrogenase (short-subunit alcohol dehydrogenase family)